MRFSNDFGDRYNVCFENGYEAHVEKNFYPLGENKPNEVSLKDKLNRTAVISEFSENPPTISLYKNKITLDQAEILVKELQDAIKFGKYLEENL